MTPRERAIEELNKKMIIDYHGGLAYLVIIHSGYGSSCSLDEYIMDELRKINATHLVSEMKYEKSTDYFLKGDIEDVRGNKDYILAVLRAKQVVEKLEEKGKSIDYRYTDTNKKELYAVYLDAHLEISEYDGRESVERGGHHIWEEEAENMIKLIEAEYV